MAYSYWVIFFTWFVGSQGTDKGTSLCLREIMYFLEQKKEGKFFFFVVFYCIFILQTVTAVRTGNWQIYQCNFTD